MSKNSNNVPAARPDRAIDLQGNSFAASLLTVDELLALDPSPAASTEDAATAGVAH